MKKIDLIKKIIRFLIIILIIITAVVSLYILPKKKNKTIESIDNTKYGYVLAKRDNSLYKEIFNLLKDELDSDTIDYEKYAEYISKLFVIDLYTLNNKVNRNDIGGIQYVKDEIKDNYKLNVSNTLYKYVGTINSNAEVNKVDLEKISETTYKIANKEYSGYEVKLAWEYKEENDYDTEGTIVLIRDNDRLYIVEKK